MLLTMIIIIYKSHIICWYFVIIPFPSMQGDSIIRVFSDEKNKFEVFSWHIRSNLSHRFSSSDAESKGIESPWNYILKAVIEFHKQFDNVILIYGFANQMQCFILFNLIKFHVNNMLISILKNKLNIQYCINTWAKTSSKYDKNNPKQTEHVYPSYLISRISNQKFCQIHIMIYVGFQFQI